MINGAAPSAPLPPRPVPGPLLVAPCPGGGQIIADEPAFDSLLHEVREFLATDAVASAAMDSDDQS